MNILVLGASGQLGSEIYALHHDSPHHYLFTGREDLDITAHREVKDFIVKRQINLIINCSAYTHVDRAEDDIDSAELVNHHGVAQLAQICTETDCALIHISTDYVFDGKSSVPYSEESLANPQNVYGKSKLSGELAVQASGCQYIILRTSWLYSTFGSNFVKTMLRLMKEKPHLRVVSDQVGTPTYAYDLARVILHIINHGLYKVSAIYHYSNEGVCSWYDFACAIGELSGSNCSVLPCTSGDYPTKAERPGYSVLSKERIKSDLGISIPHWRTSLKHCLSILHNENI